MYLRPRSKVFKRKARLAKLLRLAKTGKYSAPKLAELFGCNKKTIFMVLGDNEIVLPNLGQFTKSNFCNESFFEELNPVSVYWLGFIAADGCLTPKSKGVVIRLASKDKGHLFLRKQLKLTLRSPVSKARIAYALGFIRKGYLIALESWVFIRTRV